MGLVGMDAASTPILRALDACDNRQSEYGLYLKRLSSRSSNPAKRASRLISNSDRIVRCFGFICGVAEQGIDRTRSGGETKC
jgi:hypothetical protein